MGQQPSPRGVAGGAKAPNIFQCWWLFGPSQATVSSRPAGQQASRPAGQQAKRRDFLLGNCQMCLEISKKSKVSMGQQPTPRGVAGGAKAPNIFQCWWLFGPWQAAVSSR